MPKKKTNKLAKLPKKAKDATEEAIDKIQNTAQQLSTTANDLLDTISKAFLWTMVGLVLLTALFAYIAYKLIVLTPEPGLLITMSLVVLVVIILALIVGAYKVFKWWILSKFFKGITELLK